MAPTVMYDINDIRPDSKKLDMVKRNGILRNGKTIKKNIREIYLNRHMFYNMFSKKFVGDIIVRDLCMIRKGGIRTDEIKIKSKRIIVKEMPH